jgi:hypothetical protein
MYNALIVNKASLDKVLEIIEAAKEETEEVFAAAYSGDRDMSECHWEVKIFEPQYDEDLAIHEVYVFLDASEAWGMTDPKTLFSWMPDGLVRLGTM